MGTLFVNLKRLMLETQHESKYAQTHTHARTQALVADAMLPLATGHNRAIK